MIIEDLTWDTNAATWDSDTNIWAEVTVTVGPTRVYHGQADGIFSDTFDRIRKKRKQDIEENTEEGGIIKVLVEAKYRDRAYVTAKLMQAKFSAELVDRERYQILIIEEESSQQKPEVYFDSESPGITVELENK